jgi:hypothetical protein
MNVWPEYRSVGAAQEVRFVTFIITIIFRDFGRFGEGWSILMFLRATPVIHQRKRLVDQLLLFEKGTHPKFVDRIKAQEKTARQKVTHSKKERHVIEVCSRCDIQSANDELQDFMDSLIQELPSSQSSAPLPARSGVRELRMASAPSTSTSSV